MASNSQYQYQQDQQDQQAYYGYQATNGAQSPQPQHYPQAGYPPPLQHQNTLPKEQQSNGQPQDHINPLPRYSSPPPAVAMSSPYTQQQQTMQPLDPSAVGQQMGYSTEQNTGIISPASPPPPQPQQITLQSPAPVQTIVQQTYITHPTGVADNRASMVWKPVVHTEEDFHYSMCGCFKDFFTCKKMNTCCCGYWCPCILFSRVHHRMRSTHPITITETEFSSCNGMCCAFICLGSQALSFQQRNEIRHRYKLRGSCCGDCLRTTYCLPCTLCQEEKEIILREKQLEQLVNANRYEVSPGMTMAYVAQEKS